MEMFTISNALLSVTIRKCGAELCSIRSQKKQTEFMWNGDPAHWAGQAPVLFPIIGALKQNFTWINENKYYLPKHGIARNNNDFEIIEQTENNMKFLLKSNETSLSLYPFHFKLIINFRIEQNILFVEHEIENTGTSIMFFSLGGHPAYKCPVFEDEGYDDYFIDFGQPETDVTWLIDPDGLIKSECRPLLENQKTLALHKNIFDQNALIFKNLKTRKVSLNSRKNGKILDFDFTGFPYLGLWAKPGAPFICIEPWHGIADNVDSNQNFISKEKIISLELEQKYLCSYNITIEEGLLR